MCVYSYNNKVGLRYGNGRGFRHYHGKATTTCMGTDTQNLRNNFFDGLTVDDLIFFKRKLERRLQLINLRSPLYKDTHLERHYDELYDMSYEFASTDNFRRGFSSRN